MEFEVGYLLALVVIGLSFLGFMLAMMIDEVNRKKGIVTLILSIILFGLGIYYYYTVGQEQKVKGGPSVNKLNYYLYIYRGQQTTTVPQPLLPLMPEMPGKQQ
jgi:multisubunit Na+/H+ antiporter MnhB subunit